MARFVEDYNEDMHKLPSWIGYFFGQAGADDVIQEEMEDTFDAQFSGEDESELRQSPDNKRNAQAF